MWEEMERSRVLGAPGFNNYDGLAPIDRRENRFRGEKSSSPFRENANDLCKRSQPLAFSIAGQYRNRGVDRDELRSAGLLGLVKATRKFDPERGVPFGGFAKPWIKGEILSLFKPTRDALSLGRTTLPRNDSREAGTKSRTYPGSQKRGHAPQRLSYGLRERSYDGLA